MKKILLKLFDVVLVALIILSILAYFEICSKNTMPNPNYSPFAKFVIKILTSRS